MLSRLRSIATIGHTFAVNIQMSRKYSAKCLSSLIESLDRQLFVDYLMDDTRGEPLMNEWEVSLLNTKYFTKQTLDLLNVSLIHNQNAFKSIVKSKLISDSLPQTIYQPNIELNERQLNQLIVAERNHYLRHLLDILQRPDDESVVKGFVSNLMFRLEIISNNFTYFSMANNMSYNIDTDYNPSVPIGCIQDFLVFDNNEQTLLTIQAKPYNPSMVCQFKSTLIGSSIASAIHNYTSLQDKQLYNPIIPSLLVHSTQFHFMISLINHKYINDLMSSDCDDIQTPLMVYNFNAKPLDFCQPEDRIAILNTLLSLKSLRDLNHETIGANPCPTCHQSIYDKTQDLL